MPVSPKMLEAARLRMLAARDALQQYVNRPVMAPSDHYLFECFVARLDETTKQYLDLLTEMLESKYGNESSTSRLSRPA
jgi:hypothetical protein